MSSDSGGKVLTIVGIVIAGMTLSVDFDSSKSSSADNKVTHRYFEETKQVVSKISDTLSQFRVTVGGAKAHAADGPENYDFQDYAETEQAKRDLKTIEVHFYGVGNDERRELLDELVDQMKSIEFEYLKEFKSASTVGREIKRKEGILLSHRRQLGVLVIAMKQINPPSEYYAFAQQIEDMLHDTTA
ncbi:hypothetical protein BB427_04625 [Pseudoalteromonas sp. BMB]|uniref:hypothetical protein n=1 Tax=Pseudoalteromonas sp. BMB TaxID=1874619 RepID=UPI00083DA51F|nr:hypothetical protein [Pseudoalteromonas sp. BMB]ODB34387.1 hypothetical protein BB427_04625 [Pseudoalteromonas sp. BMB]